MSDAQLITWVVVTVLACCAFVVWVWGGDGGDRS